MAVTWTLKLGTSFDLTSLENGTKSVANFTVSKATLPGEVETKGNIIVKDSSNQANVTLSTGGAIETKGDIKVKDNEGSDKVILSTSGTIDTKGNITVKDGDSPKVTLKTDGEITSSSSVSAASGFYVK